MRALALSSEDHVGDTPPDLQSARGDELGRSYTWLGQIRGSSTPDVGSTLRLCSHTP